MCKTKLESNGEHRLIVQEKATFTVEYKQKCYPVDFVIVRGNARTILGLQSSVELGLISRIDGVTSAGKLVDDYRDVFCGLDCLNGEHYIQMRGDAKPVVHSARRVPFRLQSQFKAQLDEMEGNELITKVTEPMEWVNPLVTLTILNQITHDQVQSPVVVKLPYLMVCNKRVFSKTQRDTL